MSAEQWFAKTEEIHRRIRETQMGNIAKAAEAIAASIQAGRMVHLFGAGHGSLPVMECYPRIGGFVGYHPMTEHCLSYFTNVVGDSGVPQFLFLERLEGFAQIILQNYRLDPRDCMMIFSQSGINGVVIDMALETKRQGLTVIGLTSMEHTMSVSPRHSSGKRLCEIADIVVDTCVPAGDAMIDIPNLREKVGPGSTFGFVTAVNAINCEVARLLTERGHELFVNISHNLLPPDEAQKQMAKVWDAYIEKVKSRV
ncbi:MAG: sugar isomerase domain-containing protein [Armatimonadota bacterium]